MWGTWVIVAFPFIILPLFVQEWVSPDPVSFEKIMIALGYVFSIFTAVVFLSTAGRWAFWCAIHHLVSWWSASDEPKSKPLPPRHRIRVWWGI